MANGHPATNYTLFPHRGFILQDSDEEKGLLRFSLQPSVAFLPVGHRADSGRVPLPSPHAWFRMVEKVFLEDGVQWRVFSGEWSEQAKTTGDCHFQPLVGTHRVMEAGGGLTKDREIIGTDEEAHQANGQCDSPQEHPHGDREVPEVPLHQPRNPIRQQARSPVL